MKKRKRIIVSLSASAFKNRNGKILVKAGARKGSGIIGAKWDAGEHGACYFNTAGRPMDCVNGRISGDGERPAFLMDTRGVYLPSTGKERIRPI